MNDILFLLLAFITGLALGTIFFGGLWLTVKKSMTSAHPAFWLFASSFLRISITLVGFYYTAQGYWERLLISLLGFLIARYFILRVTRKADLLKVSGL